MPDYAFLFAGLYGVSLGVLIGSWHVTTVPMRMFVTNYSLGSHGQVWADWHAVGCTFVGAINLCAYWLTFDAVAARALLWCTIGIYTIWCAQNTRLVLTNVPRRFRPLMWLHAVMCGAVAGVCLLAVVGM